MTTVSATGRTRGSASRADGRGGGGVTGGALAVAREGWTGAAGFAGRASARAGLPYGLSTLGTRSIEEVAEAGSDRLWFQVYVWRDRDLVAELVKRSGEAGYEALCITVDTAVFGRRERDVRRGFTLPPKVVRSTMVGGILHPGCAWRFLTSEPILFANVAGREVGYGEEAVTLAEYVKSQFDPGLSWKDVQWFRSLWDGPMVIKGIQSVADAVISADHGVDAIAGSNHGGRQLDSAPASLDLIPDIAEAVGDRTEIICDGAHVAPSRATQLLHPAWSDWLARRMRRSKRPVCT